MCLKSYARSPAAKGASTPLLYCFYSQFNRILYRLILRYFAGRTKNNVRGGEKRILIIVIAIVVSRILFVLRIRKLCATANRSRQNGKVVGAKKLTMIDRKLSREKRTGSVLHYILYLF